MGKYIIAILLFAVAGGVFFVFIDPLYREVSVLRSQAGQLNEALNNAQAIQQTRDRLLSQFNAIPQNDINRVEKMLPADINNVDLVLELNRLAAQNGLGVGSVDAPSLSEDMNAVNQRTRTTAGDEQPYGSAQLGITLTGSYQAFRSFVDALDRSLRVSDIMSLSVEANNQNFNEYELVLRTYWLQ